MTKNYLRSVLPPLQKPFTCINAQVCSFPYPSMPMSCVSQSGVMTFDTTHAQKDSFHQQSMTVQTYDKLNELII
jgi:hypothetical protein